MRDCKNLDNFKRRLQKAIDTQDMEEFKKLSSNYCPTNGCDDCFFYDENAPSELTDNDFNICLRGSIMDIYWSYYDENISEETALAMLILEGIKLLAYLENEKKE